VRLVSIVVPVFNEAKSIPALSAALDEATATMPDYRFEYVFVDDGSGDDSALVLHRLASARAHVKVVVLSRNFGKEQALSAGVAYATGDAVVTMDADLQHPPSLVPELIAKWSAGAEVVIAVRRATAGKSLLRRASSRFFRVAARLFAGDIRRVEGTDFRLIDRKVRDAFLLLGERRRAYRQIVDWLGFERTTVTFDAAERFDGSSTYSWPKLWNLAIDMIVSRSSAPLRLLLYLGVLIVTSSVVSLAWMFLAFYYVDPKWKYTPLAQATVFNTLLIGIVLTAMGVLGLYIARIHEEVLARPLFTVRSTVNCEPRERLAAGAAPEPATASGIGA
jgi:dolichol-phosphate mannosyltransferase